MMPLTQEWVDKAEGDFITALRELRARKAPNYDAVCFHTQQCAEKYLKARLQEANVAFAKTHNLITLLDALLPIEPSWAAMRPALRQLALYAVEYRYPSMWATKVQAREAVALCRAVRAQVRQSLGLTP